MWRSRTTDGARIWIGDTLVADNESAPFSPPPFDKQQTNNPQTTLHGWLEPGAGTDPATWTDSDMIQVQTRASGSGAASNTIQFGKQAATATLPSGATGGFDLVTLDNDGQLSDQKQYPLTGDASTDTTTENQLPQQLRQDTNPASPSATVMLEGFGSLPAISSTGALAQEIAAIGGNADVISRFGPTQKPDANGGEYALITGRYTTPKGAVWRAQEASSERTGYGSLNALLVRDATQNDYVSMTASAGVPDPSGATSQQLMPLIYQAPSPWTDWVPDGNGGLRAPTAGEQAAFDDIAAQMQSNGWVSQTNELCPNAPDPVRGALCNSDPTALSSIANEVTGLQFDATKGTAGGYDQTVFNAVRTDISQEFNNASTIHGGLDQYQQIFGTAEINGAVDAPVIGAAIQSDLRKSSSTTGSDLLNMMSALTGMLSVVDPELGLADALDFGDSMTFMSSAFSTMGLLEPDSGPGDQLADNVQVTQATAAANLQHSLQTASDQLSIYGDYLASDPVKLIKGAALLVGPLALSGTTKNDTEHRAEYAANQYLWGTLLAPAYNIWTGPATLGTNPTCAYGRPAGPRLRSVRQRRRQRHVVIGQQDDPNQLVDRTIGRRGKHRPKPQHRAAGEDRRPADGPVRHQDGTDRHDQRRRGDAVLRAELPVIPGAADQPQAGPADQPGGLPAALQLDRGAVNSRWGPVIAAGPRPRRRQPTDGKRCELRGPSPERPTGCPSAIPCS